jgi:hypothetical protein
MTEPFLEDEAAQTLQRSPVIKLRPFKHSLDSSEQVFGTLNNTEQSPPTIKETLVTAQQFIFEDEPVSLVYTPVFLCKIKRRLIFCSGS